MKTPSAADRVWNLRNAILATAERLVTASELMDAGHWPEAGDALIFAGDSLAPILLQFREMMNGHK